MNKTSSKPGSKSPEDKDAAGPSGPPRPESREMFTEITSLMAALAKALGLPEAEAVAAVERGEVTLNLARDANGNPYVAATRAGVTSRVYQGAIKREAGKPP
ncbi:MAG: hypothetical protein EPO08_02280 [Rhodospirillaceae bacterium]|nr:MAG: hypothetical protein EPO08_02280 [Rhodospirillaceae bacterium]